MDALSLGTGLIDEHAPRNAEERATHYEPSEEEERALKLVERLLGKAKRHRSQYDRSWPKYYRMFRGKQWDTPRPSFRHSEIVNHVFKSIQSTVPIQADPKPRFEFLPQEPADFELSQILNEAAQSDWERNNWGLQLLEVLYDANFYGAGLSSLYHDPDANYKAGKICYDSADPIYFYPDPDAQDVNKKCGYVIYAEPMDVRKVKRKYPKHAQYLKADVVDFSQSVKDLAQERRQLPNDSFATHQAGSDGALGSKDQALLITCWLSPEYLQDDYEEIEHRTENDDGSVSVEYEQRAKWPTGRKIVICSKVVLEDGPNPHDDGELPFQRLLNYALPREFWGISEVEQLEGPQKTFNKVLNFALDVLTLMGNPIWVVDTNSTVDTDNLVNKPGLVVEKAPGTEVRREEGVQLQPYVMQLIDRLGEWFDSVSGSQDVTRGVQPTGITAASAISSLQEAAQTRLRLKSRLLDFYLQDLGRQWLSRTFQYRSAPEMFRLTGRDGAEKYFRMHVEEYDKTEEVESIDPMTGAPVVSHVPMGEKGRRAVVQPYGPGGMMNIDEQKVYEIRASFDVRVTTGSSLFAKAEKEQRMLALFDRGIVDEEEVLKQTDYPNYEAVLQRLMQKKQAEMEAQMAAKAPQGQPPPAVA